MSLPASLNSGETVRGALPGATANETSVGGTSMSLNVPDMESFPPMAPRRSSFWAVKAPRRAANGLPQRVASVPSFSKYSWSVRRMSSMCAPEATIRQTDSVTA